MCLEMLLFLLFVSGRATSYIALQHLPVRRDISACKRKHSNVMRTAFRSLKERRDFTGHNHVVLCWATNYIKLCVGLYQRLHSINPLCIHWFILVIIKNKY